jgi:hypothetical protein
MARINSPLPFKGGDQGVGAIAPAIAGAAISPAGEGALPRATHPNPSLEREGL